MIEDIRYAMRVFLRQPLISAVIIVTIAFGIGTNIAVFSAAETVLFRPLPYPSAEQLVRIIGDDAHYGRTPFSYPDYQDWCLAQRTFAEIAAYTRDDFNFKLRSQSPRRVAGAIVTANLIPLLGLSLEKGRSFTLTEGRELVSPTPAILSYGFWHKEFGAKTDILGQTFILNDRLCQVIGIASENMEHPGGIDLYLPIGLLSREPDYTSREMRRFYGVGRLRPQSTRAKGQADLKRIAAALAVTHPQTNRNTSVIVSSELDESRQKYRRTFYLLLGAAVAVFLIAAINVVNLRLNQIDARSQEWAVRAAIGASFSQIARLITLEGAVLAIAGGSLGIVGAVWILNAMSKLAPVDLPRLGEFRLDSLLLVFSLLLIAILGTLAGLIPAVKLDFRKLAGALRGADRIGSPGTTRIWQSVLVILQITFSFTLYIAAALLLRTLWQLQAMPLGFDPQNVLTGQVDLPSNRYANDAQIVTFFERIIEETTRIPGVESAAVSTAPPFGAVHLYSSLVGLGHEQSTLANQPQGTTLAECVSGDYFRVLRIPILRGRHFGPRDSSDSPPATIIGEEYAERFWPGQGAIGEQLVSPDGKAKKRISVIGVVSHVLHDAGTADEPASCIYFPLRQRAAAYGTLLIRTKKGYDPVNRVPVLRGCVEKVDPDQPIYNVRTMLSTVKESLNAN